MAEKDEAQPYVFMGSLHNNWGVSSELGVMMGEFAVTEHLLVSMLSRIIEDNEPEILISHNIFGQIQSVSLRIDIVSACAKVSKMSNELKLAFEEAVSLARSINSVRNEYVHATYKTNVKTGKVMRTLYATSTTRKSPETEINYESVKKDRLDILKNNSKIINLIFSDKIETALL